MIFANQIDNSYFTRIHTLLLNIFQYLINVKEQSFHIFTEIPPRFLNIQVKDESKSQLYK